MRVLLIAALAFGVAAAASSQSAPVLELDGFMLGQGEYAVTETLGKPDDRVEDDNDGYVLSYNKGSGGFEAFIFRNEMPGVVFGIQVTGRAWQGSPKLLGLALGSSLRDLVKVCGLPTTMELVKFALPDQTEKRDSMFYNYKNYNYSFVVQDDKIVSMRILGLRGFTKNTPEHHPLYWFAQAIQKDDYALLRRCLMPNVQLLQAGREFRIEEPFSQFVEKRNSPVYNKLFTDPDSLASVLSNYEFSDLALRQEPDGMYVIMTGLDRNPIQELVFTFWADEFRLVKVVYRDPE